MRILVPIAGLLFCLAACSLATGTGSMTPNPRRSRAWAFRTRPSWARDSSGNSYYSFVANATTSSLPAGAYVDYSLYQGSALILDNLSSSYFYAFKTGTYTLVATVYGYGSARSVVPVSIARLSTSITL